MMTEKEAYGDRSYWQRQVTQYRAGDKVTVGPAYRGNGQYCADGYEGNYTVVKYLDGGDYQVARGDRIALYDLIVHSSRLTRR